MKRQKNTRGKRKKKVSVIKKIKGLVVVSFVAFIAGGFLLNSKYVTSSNGEAYSQLLEKYSIESPAKTEVTDPSEKLEKRLYLNKELDLRTPSNVTVDEMEKMLEGTGLSGLGKAFVEAEQKYSVNAIYLMGLAAEESGYGTSSFAKLRNNLMGWCAYDSDPNKAMYFETKEACILHVASKLKANYLTEGGAYFEGYTVKAIDVHYASDKLHGEKIIDCANNLLNKLG